MRSSASPYPSVRSDNPVPRLSNVMSRAYNATLRIGTVPVTFIDLTRNFRSQARIVEWLNDVFPPVFAARGVYVTGTNSQVTSSGGAVGVTGTGGGTGTSGTNYGVYVQNGGVVTSAGAGAAVTVIGNGRTATGGT